jgi:hypothetical protein
MVVLKYLKQRLLCVDTADPAFTADDPIAAAIKRLAGSSAISSPQSIDAKLASPEIAEEAAAKHPPRERAPSCAAAKANSSRGISARGLSSPCLASPSRSGRPDSLRLLDS